MLMTIETAMSAIDPIRTISGLIFTPWVSSLKKVSRPALDAGIGALSFLLMRFVDVARPFLRITRGEVAAFLYTWQGGFQS